VSCEWPHETALRFEYGSSGSASRVERALRPEIGDIDDDRSRVELTRESDHLELRITARDLIALRASLNTWLSLVTVAEQAGATT